MPLVLPSCPDLWRPANSIHNVEHQVKPYLLNARLLQRMHRCVVLTAPMFGSPLEWGLMSDLVIIAPQVTSVWGTRIGLAEHSPIMPLTPYMVYRNECCEANWEDEHGSVHFKTLKGFAARAFQQLTDSLRGVQIFDPPIPRGLVATPTEDLNNHRLFSRRPFTSRHHDEA